MEDKVQIVFIHLTDGKEERICHFATSRFAEWLKLLQFAKDNEIVFYPREDDDNINKEILDAVAGIGYTIEDFNVSFGSNDCIQMIEVLLK